MSFGSVPFSMAVEISSSEIKLVSVIDRSLGVISMFSLDANLFTVSSLCFGDGGLRSGAVWNMPWLAINYFCSSSLIISTWMLSKAMFWAACCSIF